MPGREQHAAFPVREFLQVGQLRQGGRRRLFQQHVLAGRQRFVRDPVPHARRGVDCDHADLRQGAIELGRGLEDRHVAVAEAAGADDSRKLERIAGPDHRHMLVLGDLAEADDGDLALAHSPASCSKRCDGAAPYTGLARLQAEKGRTAAL